MSSFTLYRETPCEHGAMERHVMAQSGPNLEVTEGVQHGDRCPGSSREEVVIDYEAAADAWDRQPSGPRTRMNAVRAIVDAALGE